MTDILTTKEYAALHGLPYIDVLRAVRAKTLPARRVQTIWYITSDTPFTPAPIGRPSVLSKRLCHTCGKPITGSLRKYCSPRCRPRYDSFGAPDNPRLITAVAIRKSNPCATLQSIANETGVSRERVRQYLVAADKPTRHWTPPRNKFYCMSCGIPTPKPLCPECQEKQRWVEVACDYCGKLTKKLASVIISNLKHNPGNHLFCNRVCLGSWMAAKGGFGVHPENMHGGNNRKYDYDMVWQKHLKTGYGSWRLSPILGISRHSIEATLHKMRRAKNEDTIQ